MDFILIFAFPLSCKYFLLRRWFPPSIFCFIFLHFNKLLLFVLMVFGLLCQTVNCHVHVINVYLLCWSLPLLFGSPLFVSLLDNCCFSCTPTFAHLSVCLLHTTFLFPLTSFIQCCLSHLPSPCLLHQSHRRPSSRVFKLSFVNFLVITHIYSRMSPIFNINNKRYHAELSFYCASSRSWHISVVLYLSLTVLWHLPWYKSSQLSYFLIVIVVPLNSMVTLAQSSCSAAKIIKVSQSSLIVAMASRLT